MTDLSGQTDLSLKHILYEREGNGGGGGVEWDLHKCPGQSGHSVEMATWI